MYSIFRKELNLFFSSVIGYVVIILFLMLNGLFLWVIPNNNNILEFGYASLDKYFEMAPWVLLFLIPAVTMRSFADEFRGGTIEMLFTKPVTTFQIVCGKYLASLVLVIAAILPTLLYIVTVSKLATQGSVLDYGGIAGSYIGLTMLAASFTAIGVFASSLTSNQVVSFLISLFLCYLLYMGFDFIANMKSVEGTLDYLLSLIGMAFHYDALSKGVIDSRDMVYFLTIIFFFIIMTKTALESYRWEKTKQ
jgi:ABC-2 type transport system permease protein